MMKIKFKSQAYQSVAVDTVVDCFQGQPKLDSVKYRMDKGIVVKDQQTQMDYGGDANESAFKNASIQLDEVSYCVISNKYKVGKTYRLTRA